MPAHNFNAGSACYIKLSIRLAEDWDEKDMYMQNGLFRLEELY